MRGYKGNKILLGMTILSMFIMLIGATFSYFSANSKGRENAVVATAASIKVNLNTSQIYIGDKIIPLLDTDIAKAYGKGCVDDLGNKVCAAYGLEIFNYSIENEMEGLINFDISGINNLSYMVLDSSGNVYKDVTHINPSNSTNLSLGNSFKLLEGTDDEPTSKSFTLLIWLSEIGTDQNSIDGDGTFSASVTYRSNGTGLTASVQGFSV